LRNIGKGFITGHKERLVAGDEFVQNGLALGRVGKAGGEVQKAGIVGLTEPRLAWTLRDSVPHGKNN
jgi:hypothetical protein